METSARYRQPLTYLGGKYRLAPWICSYLPATRNYIEPFFGGGSVFFYKPRSDFNVVNDINGELVNFFRVLRDEPEELIRKIMLTPYARDEFLAAAAEDTSGMDDVERARRTFVKTRYSIQHTTKVSGSNFMVMPVKTYCPSESVKHGLENAARLLNEVLIENMDAEKLVKLYDSNDRYGDTLIYCDPPYVQTTRTFKNAYGDEMSDSQHEGFLEALKGCGSKVAVSGYNSEMYNDMLGGWN